MSDTQTVVEKAKNTAVDQTSGDGVFETINNPQVRVSRYLIFVGIASFAIVLLIVSLQGYRALIGQKVDSVKNLSLDPINPKIEMEVLDEIAKKKEYQVDLSQISLKLAVKPATEPEATESAQAENQEATNSSVLLEEGQNTLPEEGGL